MTPLHRAETLFAARHLPSWFLLCATAGAVNAGGFLACQRFVTHVTGTATRIGLHGHAWHLVVDYVAVLVCFLLGALSAALAIDGRLVRGRAPWYAAPMVGVATLLAAVAVAGEAGLFGPFGGEVDQAGDFVFLCVLGYAMGLQNAAVTTATGAVVRTTHMTGPATDLGIHLATAVTAGGARRAEALRQAGLRAGKIVSFVAGGALMVPVAERLGFLAFLVPAGVVLAVTARSFVSRTSAPDARPSPAR